MNTPVCRKIPLHHPSCSGHLRIEDIFVWEGGYPNTDHKIWPLTHRIYFCLRRGTSQHWWQNFSRIGAHIYRLVLLHLFIPSSEKENVREKISRMGQQFLSCRFFWGGERQSMDKKNCSIENQALIHDSKRMISQLNSQTWKQRKSDLSIQTHRKSYDELENLLLKHIWRWMLWGIPPPACRKPAQRQWWMISRSRAASKTAGGKHKLNIVSPDLAQHVKIRTYLQESHIPPRSSIHLSSTRR